MNLISQGVRARGGGTPGFRLSFTCSIFLRPEKDESRSRQNGAPKLMKRPDMKMPSNLLIKAPHHVNTAKSFPFVQPRLSPAFSEAFICFKLPHNGWLEKVQLNVLIYSGERNWKSSITRFAHGTLRHRQGYKSLQPIWRTIAERTPP